MNDIYITLTGNVAAEPRQYSFDEGVKVTSLRVLTTHRYFDKRAGQWVDGEKVCFTVRCWRALGENVAASVRAGHPVVVSGKLRIREFGAEGDRRFMPEIEASAVGHDLRWGTGAFTKPERGGSGAVSKEMRDRLDEETRDWAMGPRPQRSLSRSPLREEPNPFHTSDDNEQPLTTVSATVGGSGAAENDVTAERAVTAERGETAEGGETAERGMTAHSGVIAEGGMTVENGLRDLGGTVHTLVPDHAPAASVTGHSTEPSGHHTVARGHDADVKGRGSDLKGRGSDVKGRGGNTKGRDAEARGRDTGTKAADGDDGHLTTAEKAAA
ncbi:single-stranded DNA-binding protein [Nonomuraea sp. FMUSA5-5]|uniref:Single-stranded DNA-binding protein n=1 Tax=Nonomuraea composti TaxID=2720023 RepID=A0ABX1B984_9ACTN|nr:single-stranded DNA-binding protein [Nonomuraea sp. FMUSA5-5]NJP94359.1 single-stranded DNA-binding protein [Nonomuraea sp. FMUSA5-5]